MSLKYVGVLNKLILFVYSYVPFVGMIIFRMSLLRIRFELSTVSPKPPLVEDMKIIFFNYEAALGGTRNVLEIGFAW
jgi:hypothetical protein